MHIDGPHNFDDIGTLGHQASQRSLADFAQTQMQNPNHAALSLVKYENTARPPALESSKVRDRPCRVQFAGWGDQVESALAKGSSRVRSKHQSFEFKRQHHRLRL